MRVTHRHRPIDLTRRLLQAPQSFEFYQAIRILGHSLAKPAGGDASARIRFRNSVSLIYPVGDIESIRVLRDGKVIVDIDESLAALSDRNVEVEVTQAFLGLLGVFGVLPLGYTEMIAFGEAGRRDNAARAFLDVLSERPVAQYYAAWRYHHPVLGYEETGESSLERVMKSLAGHSLGSPSAAADPKAGPVSDENIARVCAALRHKPMSGPYLGQVLSACLGEEIRVEDFVGAWYDLPSDVQARLGTANVALGVETVLGQRSWQRHLRLKLHVGPLRIDRYRAYLADGEAAGSLGRWLAAMLGHTCEYEIVPLLHRDDVGAICLGVAGPGRLGRDAFLASGPSPVHRGDGRYLLSL
jgi:type VI secretion system protein ImpH